MANVSPKMVFGMSFIILSNTNVDFLDRKLCWKTYTTKKVLPTTKHVELIGKKEFVAAVLDLENEMLIVHIASLDFTASFSSTLLNIVYSLYRL